MSDAHQTIENLKQLLEDTEVFIIAWASHYAHTHDIKGWHPDHLRWLNKVRSATGGHIVTMKELGGSAVSEEG